MEKHIEEARNLLEHLTPLKTDCGLICGAACCHPDEDGQGGVMLFPGEAALYTGADWARVEDGILYCGGRCPRGDRPLGCRIFPLTPFRKKSGALPCASTGAPSQCARWRRAAFARWTRNSSGLLSWRLPSSRQRLKAANFWTHGSTRNAYSATRFCNISLRVCP